MRWKSKLLMVLLSVVSASASSEDGLLSVDEAFPVRVESRRGSEVDLRVNVAPGYALYRDMLGIEIVAGASGVDRLEVGALDTIVEPGGERREVVLDGAVVRVIFAGTGADPIRFRLRSQGCLPARGICFNPAWRDLAAR